MTNRLNVRDKVSQRKNRGFKPRTGKKTRQNKKKYIQTKMNKNEQTKTKITLNQIRAM